MNKLFKESVDDIFVDYLNKIYVKYKELQYKLVELESKSCSCNNLNPANNIDSIPRSNFFRKRKNSPEVHETFDTIPETEMSTDKFNEAIINEVSDSFNEIIYEPHESPIIAEQICEMIKKAPSNTLKNNKENNGCRSPLKAVQNNAENMDRFTSPSLCDRKQHLLLNITNDLKSPYSSPDKCSTNQDYNDNELFNELPRRQSLNSAKKENILKPIDDMTKPMPSASSSSRVTESKWHSKKSKTFCENWSTNISFIQPILNKSVIKTSTKSCKSDDINNKYTEEKHNSKYRDLSISKKFKLKQATINFQKELDNVRKNDDTNATFCADISLTKPSGNNSTVHQKTLTYLKNKQLQKLDDDKVFNFDKLNDNILKRRIKKEKCLSILDSKNDDYKQSNSSSLVDDSIFAISNETDDIIILENTESIINIKDDDENSTDLIEKMNSKKYCEDGSTPLPLLRNKTEKEKRPGYLCAECERYYGILDLSDEEYQKRVDRCSKHCNAQFMNPTPDGFWKPFFTPTPEKK